MNIVNPCGSSESTIKAITIGSTRTQATYTPAAQGVAAMTSDLDIALTPPTGTTKAILQWSVMGEANASGGRTGFVVYRDVAGGGYALLANSRDGSANYYSVITTPARDTDAGTTGNTTVVTIIDESPTVGSVNTYRLYAAGTDETTTETFSLNKVVNAVGDSAESGLTTFRGECI